MRVVNGKQITEMARPALDAWCGRFEHVVVDLGAGDGRFVRQLAARNPDTGAIGVDLCAANLRAASRVAGENALFVVADARTLPEELYGTADRATIHFPWGSLLRGLLAADSGLFGGLHSLGTVRTCYEITLNAGALAEAGYAFEAGNEHVRENLRDAGFSVDAIHEVSPVELHAMPTAWAKRLAFGRDPRAISISGRWSDECELRTSRPPSPVPAVLHFPADRRGAGLVTKM
jgi:16S rRNA (adenine(1408)-N(1))-methyltransferase